jgi:transcriptional regulator with XRE-family HTH domain
MLTNGKQIAAARQLLDWSQEDLAGRSGVSKPTIIRMEKDLYSVKDDLRNKVITAFSNDNIEFTPMGVQAVTHKITQFEGTDGFRQFMWDVYNTASETGGDIRLFNARPEYWHKWLGAEWYNEHAARMQTIKDKITFHAISNENNNLFIANNFGEYRWFPRELFNDKAFYAYGNKLGFLNFGPSSLNIVVIDHKDFADAFRVLFEIAWDTVAIIPDQGSNNE